MISDEIENTKIIDLLGLEDLRIIEEARRLLASPSGLSNLDLTNDSKLWYTSNVECQTKLENLKSRVDIVKWNKYYLGKETEGKILIDDPDLRDDYRNREDRVSVMIASSSELRDLNISYHELDSISTYVGGLIWGLRNLTSVLNMKN